MISNTDWFRDARWGLMFHYLLAAPDSGVDTSTVPADEWNERVDSFDVSRFAEQIRDVGAGYVMFTIGQNTGHFCSPNATYDRLTGIRPSKCSRRDLIGECAEALARVGVRMIAYLPSAAPTKDSIARDRLRFNPPWDASGWGYDQPKTGVELADERLTEGQRNWEAVIREWSLRWGRSVSGWWIDGCYFADRMYRHTDEPNFGSFAAALRAGNPDGILAFNAGTADPFVPLCPEQDYAAGEVADKFPVSYLWRPLTRDMKGCHLHVLSFLGLCWGMGDTPRCGDDLIVGYTRHINSKGGTVTWDVPIGGNGVIPTEFSEQLRVLGAATR